MAKSLRKPRAIDLFSGCGGLTLGLKQAGFKIIGAVERDALAVEAYRSNHRTTRIWPIPIENLLVEAVRQSLGLLVGELDLLAGCPPCQGFSTLRTLNGGRDIVDPRNDLVFDFLRFVRGLMPKTVMMENVPGLANDGRIEDVKTSLRRLGYDCDVKVLDAADFGVPQRRKRMILLASRVGDLSFPEPSQVTRTVRDAIGSLPPPGESGDWLHDIPVVRAKHVQNLIRRIPKDGGSRTDLDIDQQLPCHRKCNGFKDIYGRMAWDSVAPTITSGCINPSKGRFLHPEQDRAITLREASLLQGFGPNYRFPVHRGKYPVATLIGNAFPAEFVAHQVRAIRSQFPSIMN